MKTRENITLFECDFCKKRLIRKAAMELHEELCNSNPKNMKACMDCKFIKPEQISYYKDSYMGEYEIKTTAFRCTALDKLMYPFKAEKKGLPDEYPEQFEGQEAMPVKCDKHKWVHE